MGTLVRITLYASGVEEAKAAFARGFARIRELDAAFSDYKADSEVSRLNTAPHRASADLLRVLRVAQRVARDTDGAFDVTAGALTHLYRAERERGRLPLAEAVEAARHKVGYRKLLLSGDTVRFAEEGMALDLGGIAKGYGADEALKATGVRRALVAVSGDVAVGEAPPGQKGWRVTLAAVDQPMELQRCGVSTSGDTDQFVEVGGVRYSHIVDPRTGRPVVGGGLVSVIARTAMEADAVATALSVEGGSRYRGVRVFRRKNT